MKNWYLHDGKVYRDQQLFTEDVLIIDGKIAAFGQEAQERRANTSLPIQDISAKDCIISRGFIDLHVHLRQPGFEAKETIATGTAAAAAGGFTTVYAMPNTRPAIDSLTNLNRLQHLIDEFAIVKVFPIAALTKGRLGEQLVDYADLTDVGVKFFSDDGDALSTDLLYDAMDRITKTGGVVINHLEDKKLVEPGLFHHHIPAESEYLMLKRDLEAVRKTHCRYHAAHLSCAQSVELIAKAKSEGLPVTAEVTPHHLTLTFKDIKEPQGHYQMKPPLRTSRDQRALIKGVKKGIIDIIATDHAPHGDEKRHTLNLSSPFGVTGLETAFPALYSTLVLTNKLSIEDLLECLTHKPAQIVGEHTGLGVGVPADIVVLNLKSDRLVDYQMFHSKGTNSPYIGETLFGWPILTLIDGREGYRCHSTVN